MDIIDRIQSKTILPTYDTIPLLSVAAEVEKIGVWILVDDDRSRKSDPCDFYEVNVSHRGGSTDEISSKIVSELFLSVALVDCGLSLFRTRFLDDIGMVFFSSFLLFSRSIFLGDRSARLHCAYCHLDKYVTRFVFRLLVCFSFAVLY